MSEKQTPAEVCDSLTGFDEMAIVEHFGRDIASLLGEPGMYRRALIFVAKRREGLDEDAARNAALDMRLADVLEFFADTETVESGKDEPLSEPQPEPSPASVS